MSEQSATQEDSSLLVSLPIRLRQPWRVEAVQALPGFRLWVRFLDGTEGIVSLAAKVHSPGAGVFSVLADPAVFARAHVVLGAVTWFDDLDLAPDALYDEIRAQQAHG
ncbi:DUF2442 domain-containing protein [Castellaniella caeni]|uniref:DUF2442 domain-containing protein n=1 Tax=Castellaniella caeni TaxID=266123 RepID=UPI000A00F0E8|nr:DUF2442 domain-containing protein [Castellaniella caeni]